MRWNSLLRWISSLLLVGLAVCVLTEDTAAQDPGNLYNTAVDARMGRQHFERRCSRCHGQDATGNDETGAPDLTRRLSNTNTRAGVFQIIREGIAGTAMLPVSAGTPDPTVWQLVTYIESLKTDPANINLPGSVSSGKQIYAGDGKCANCHMMHGVGGRLGPDLSRIGERRNPDELKTDLVTPTKDLGPRWWTVRVALKDGSILQGLRMNEDSFTLRIMDSQDNLWSFSKNELSSYEYIKESTMPSYGSTLSASEIDDLVAYLFSLRKEN